MALMGHYQLALTQVGIREDSHQCIAVQELQNLYDQIITIEHKKSSFSTILSRILPTQTTIPVKGCYLWGGVGRGKTWLMDMFFQSIPVNNKARFHFQPFMQYVHAELATVKGQRDPLKLVAAKIATNCRVLCIDEFHVADIVDAMLLNGLLEALFKQHVVLVATSNQEPDELYKNGLQRSRFIPAIDLIKSHTKIVNLGGGTDYRGMVEMDGDRYITREYEQPLQYMKTLFEKYNQGSSLSQQKILVNKRLIDTLLVGVNVVWFDFEVLCGSSRAAIDYIKIGQEYSTVLLSTVPVLTEEQDDKARRFVHLIDELYDKKTHLVLVAEAEPQNLYQGKRLNFEFTRTASRLVEMRSRSYVVLAQ